MCRSRWRKQIGMIDDHDECSGWMFLLVPAHTGCPGQIPQSRKTVVCVCVFWFFQYESRDWLGRASPQWSMCLTIFFHNLSPSFFGLPLGLAPSTLYSIHFYFALDCCTNFVLKLQKDWRKRKKKTLFLDYSCASNHEADSIAAFLAMCRLVRNFPACTLHVMCTFEMCGPGHAFLRKLVNLLLVTWISRTCWMVLKTCGMKVHNMYSWFVCKILWHLCLVMICFLNFFRW